MRPLLLPLLARLLAATLLLTLPATAAARLGEPDPWPSFAENGGLLQPGEHAVLLYLDAELLLPPVMAGYRLGLLHWLELGLDVGGNRGVVQGFVQCRAKLYESEKTRRFFAGARLRTGPKDHRLTLGNDALVFDDRGWVMVGELSGALRLGRRLELALYLSSIFYAEVDIRSPARQTDLFWVPLSAGLEYRGENGVSVFAELGPVWMINGTETDKGLLYEGSWFPVGQIGMAIRLPSS